MIIGDSENLKVTKNLLGDGQNQQAFEGAVLTGNTQLPSDQLRVGYEYESDHLHQFHVFVPLKLHQLSDRS